MAFEAAGTPARFVDRDEQVEVLSAIDPPEDRALLDELGGYIDVRATVDGLVGAYTYSDMTGFALSAVAVP